MADALPLAVDRDPDEPGPIFIPPDGFAFVQLPRVKLSRSGVDVLTALLVCRRRPTETVLKVSDAYIAEVLAGLGRPFSRRFIQKGLKALETAELILRAKVLDLRGRGREFVRQITLKFRNAGPKIRTPKAKAASTVGPKNFGPPCAHTGATPAPIRTLSLECSREQEKENKAGAADVRLEGRSSSPAGEGETDQVAAPVLSPEEAGAFLRAKLAEVAAATAVAAPKRVEAPRAAESWRPKPRWRALHELPEAEKERLAATDPIIRRELEQARAAIQAADEAPSGDSAGSARD